MSNYLHIWIVQGVGVEEMIKPIKHYFKQTSYKNNYKIDHTNTNFSLVIQSISFYDLFTYLFNFLK